MLFDDMDALVNDLFDFLDDIDMDLEEALEAINDLEEFDRLYELEG